MLFLKPSLSHSLVLILMLSGCTSISQKTPENSVSALKTTESTTPATVIKKSVDIFRLDSYDKLPGWYQDDLREAWPAFLASCKTLNKKSEWLEPCAIAQQVVPTDPKAVRLFFETFLVPYQILNADGTDQGLVTGYYEPLLRGARKRSGPFQTPLYRTPDDLLTVELGQIYPELKSLRLRGRLQDKKIVPYWTRAELIQKKLLGGKEILWVDDAVEAFFLQVQGSGRVDLVDSNERVRLSYADQNGQPYKSVGRYLVDLGELSLDKASAQAIKAWYVAHPERQQELLNANPSFVFFKEEKILNDNIGPKGALGVPLTPQRSIAVDPQFVPNGVPVFLATTQPASEKILQKLVLAQDTGGAIRGAVRADFFWGFGVTAGEHAGKMKQRGKMWVLLPRTLK